MFGSRYGQSALLRLVMVRDCDCDWPDAYKSHECRWHLEHVERVDGLLDLQRVEGMDDDVFSFETKKVELAAGAFDPRRAHFNRGSVNWARFEWEGCGFDMVRYALEDDYDLARIERIVVTGNCWDSTDYYGEHDGGFDMEAVEAVVYSRPEYAHTAQDEREERALDAIVVLALRDDVDPHAITL